MGSVAGIVYWDGRPLEASDLTRVASATAHRPADGASAAVHGPVGLARRRFDTTSTEDYDQPLYDENGGVRFVFDGRLDNREDLIRSLGLDGTPSDARLALAAVVRWAEHGAARLLGDFAFIAWDERQRRAICARDHMGTRPLHYFASARLLVCATDLAQVLAHPAVPRRPNPAVAAEHLAVSIQNGPGTLYRDVHRVPPGHVLIADARSARLHRYWTPEPGQPIRYRSDDEYAAQCREILVRSVGDRMRSDRPVAAFLSGGLDSSAVVTVAHRLVQGRGLPPRPFSMVFPDHPEGDERPFIDAVIRSCGTAGVQILPGAITAGALAARAARWLDSPGMPADEMTGTTFRAISSQGHRVVLTGAGGDFLFTGSVFQAADLLRAGRPIAAARRLFCDWRGDDTGQGARGLLQAGIWPLLPRRCKSLLRPMARRVYGVKDQPEWLRIRRVLPEYPAAPRGGSHATEEMTRGLGSGMHAFFLDSHERAAAESGIELRNPLLDRRLIEFALNIPDEQRKRGAYTKYVLRRAVSPHLADAVSRRRSKAGFSHTAIETFEALGGERWFATLRIAEAGWVDPGPICHDYLSMRARFLEGRAPTIHLPSLWMITAVELWFRAAFDTSAGGAHHGAAL